MRALILFAAAASLTVPAAAATPIFSVEPTTAHQADGFASVAIHKDGENGMPSTIAYTTVDYTAVQGKHYRTTGSTLTYLPGQKTVHVKVPLINVGHAKARRFGVQIVAGSNARIGTSYARVTILP